MISGKDLSLQKKDAEPWAKHKYNPDYYFPRERGVSLDSLSFIKDVSIYSCSPYIFAKKTALLLLSCGAGLSVTDATAHIGADTIALSQVFDHVNAVEIDKESFEALKNNVSLYNRKNVTITCADYTESWKEFKQDIVYIDAPWGGPSYKSSEKLKLYLSGIEVLNLAEDLLKNKACSAVALKVPINYHGLKRKSIRVHEIKNRKGRTLYCIMIIQSSSSESK